MITGKTRALTRRNFVVTVMSLLFNMVPKLVITFLPKSKRLNFMAAVTICSDWSGAAAERSYPLSEVRGGGWEDQPHARGQGWRLGGPTGGCAGAGGPRGAIPH